MVSFFLLIEWYSIVWLALFHLSIHWLMGLWLFALTLLSILVGFIVIAGAFCYDVVLDKRLDEWMPTKVSVTLWSIDFGVCAFLC